MRSLLLIPAFAQPCAPLLFPGGLSPSLSIGDTFVSTCDDPLFVDAASAARPLACAATDAAYTGGAGHPSVQAAIDAAADGDVVFVCPGAHTESLVVDGRVLELSSADGDPATTSIDGGTGRALKVTGSTLTVSDLALTGQAPRGGAVFASDTELHLLRVAVTDAVATEDGGGVYAEASTVRVDGSTFADAVADYAGGGIALFDSCGEISGSTFERNFAGYEGGAVSWSAESDDEMLGVWDSTFTDNVGGYEGGALSFGGFADGVLGVIGGRFVGNLSDYGGGAIAGGGWERIEVFVSGAEFEANVAGHNGGAVSTGNHGTTFLTVEGSTFTGNAADYAGGAIGHSSWSKDVVTIASSTFVENEAEHGTAVDVSGWERITFTIDGGTFTDNVSTVKPSAATLGHQDGYVQGVDVDFVDTVAGLTHLTSECGDFTLGAAASFTCDRGKWSTP